MVARVQNIDVFRVIAILAVILLHATPFENPATPVGFALDLATILNQLARFAVPYFLLISGYLLGHKAQNGPDILHYVLKLFRRLILALIVWSAIYLLPFDYTSHHSSIAAGIISGGGRGHDEALDLQRKVLIGMFQGTRVHLWFLISLLWCSGITTAFILTGRIRWLVVLSVALYAFGLLAKAYSGTPLGLNIEFDTRNGPFFGLIFFTTGYLLSFRTPNERWLLKGILLLLLGYSLHFIEIGLLHYWFGTSLVQDYVGGTYLIGVGAGMIALSGKRIPGLHIVGPLGQYVFGIYLCHYIFIDLLRGIDPAGASILWQIIHVPLVFFLSLILVIALSRFSLGQKLMGGA
jgi:surface polysaccharide O-acyltransferase-like enzyme